MRFTRYPRWEPYEVTPRKLAAARRAIQKQKDRYPLFPELIKHQTPEERLASIAVEREAWWQRMRDRHANVWRKAHQNLNSLPPGPRAAIKRYWEICGRPGDPVYLLTIIHEHRDRKVCYWYVMAELRRLRLRFQKSS
jgi:hypothetical protein